MAMACSVLRVRLIGGEHLDVTYEEDGRTPGETVELRHLDHRGT
jgi:hypothetical protein